MAKILFIAPYPKGEAPSQRFRFEQYFDVLNSEGHQLVHRSFLSRKTWRALYKEGTFFSKAFGILGSFWNRFTLLFTLSKYDFIFIHREASMIGPPVFEWIISKILRKKYIYDFDDAIWLPNYSDSNARFNRLKAYWKIKYIIKWAHKVTAGNNYLAEYAGKYNKNIQIIPTTVDLVNVHNVKIDDSKRPLTIVWTGTHTTMNYLDSIIPVLKDLEADHNFILKIISNHPPSLDYKNVEYVKWNKETEIEDLSKAHIGIMPMEDSEWSRGKCGFKGIQYMSLGMPAIFAPVGVNNEIVENEINGFLCSTADEWKQVLARLLENEELRNQIGNEGHETIKERFSVERNKTKYINLFRL